MGTAERDRLNAFNKKFRDKTDVSMPQPQLEVVDDSKLKNKPLPIKLIKPSPVADSIRRRLELMKPSVGSSLGQPKKVTYHF